MMRLKEAKRTAVFAIALLGALACEGVVSMPENYGVVRVEARSRSGLPLPGIPTELYTGLFPVAYATTDAQGNVTFRRVPRGDYGISMALPTEYADLSELLGGPTGTIKDAIPVMPGTDTTLRFTYAIRRPGSIEAEVVDQNGDGIPGITAGFYTSTQFIGTRLTNAAGIARADSAPFGMYGVFILVPDTIGAANPGQLYSDAGTVVDFDVVPRVRFTLVSCIGSVRAQVLDQFDDAAPGATVILYTGSGVRRTLSTGADGRATFSGIGCGNYGVAITAAPGYTFNGAFGFGYRDGLVLTSGAELDAALRVSKNP